MSGKYGTGVFLLMGFQYIYHFSGLSSLNFIFASMKVIAQLESCIFQKAFRMRFCQQLMSIAHLGAIAVSYIGSFCPEAIARISL